MLSRRGKPENKSTKQPPKADNKNKPEDAAKANLILQMQRTFGNKAVLQMLLNERNKLDLETTKSLGIDALEKYPLTAHAQLLPAHGILSLQIEAYTKILSAYNDFGIRCSQGSAAGFFWKYHLGFRNSLVKLIKGVIIPNIRDFMQLNQENTTNDPDADQERLTAVEELVSQFEERANGQDLDEVEKRVPKPDAAAINSPAQDALQKQLASGAMYNLKDVDFFEGFLKKNGMDYAVFELVIKTAEAWKMEENSTADDVADRMKQWRSEQKKYVAE